MPNNLAAAWPCSLSLAVLLCSALQLASAAAPPIVDGPQSVGQRRAAQLCLNAVLINRTGSLMVNSNLSSTWHCNILLYSSMVTIRPKHIPIIQSLLHELAARQAASHHDVLGCFTETLQPACQNSLQWLHRVLLEMFVLNVAACLTGMSALILYLVLSC